MTASEITIDDVARAAGVSPSTVSRVLSGRTNVAANKRELVLKTVQEMGYLPNPTARVLAGGRSMSIGVLTQDITSPFYGEVIHGIQQGLRGSFYQPLFASGHWDLDAEDSAFKMLMSRRVDALIVLGTHTPDEDLLAVTQKMPVVTVGRLIGGNPYSGYKLDNVQAARTAVRHLLDLGHQRIAHIAGPQHHSDARDRLEGYRQELAAAGLPFDARIVAEGDFMETSGLMAMEALIARGVPFTAIFSANDQMAFGARLALFRRNLRVPEDISLVGFDDIPGSSFITPPLTTIRQPNYDLGMAAARAVLHFLNDQPVQNASFTADLVARESTARVRPGAPTTRRRASRELP